MIVTCPKCQTAVEVTLSTWVRTEPKVSRALDFASMTLVQDSSGVLDSEDRYHQGKALAAAWSDDHIRDGWTKDEWLTLGRDEFDVRRVPNGHWEIRLCYRDWLRKCRLNQQGLEKGRNFVDEMLFEQLHGFSWQQWLDREKEPLPRNIQRPWTPVPDEWWPSIETAYQRYIHQG